MSGGRLPAFGDEHGLVGKLVLLSLLLVALLAVAAIDAGSILFLRVRTRSRRRRRERGRRGVRRLSRRARGQARGPRDDRGLGGPRPAAADRGCDHGDVTVEVSARADTIVVDWIPFLDDLATVTVTRMSPAP